MKFSDYQRSAFAFAQYPDAGKGNWTYPALGLAGESGEVCEKLKKVIRDKGGRIDEETRIALSLELSDVLWYIAALCTELELDMSDVAYTNIAKLANREKRGVIQGSGDDR